MIKEQLYTCYLQGVAEWDEPCFCIVQEKYLETYKKFLQQRRKHYGEHVYGIVIRNWGE